MSLAITSATRNPPRTITTATTITGGSLRASLNGLRQSSGIVTAHALNVQDNGREGVILLGASPNLVLDSGSVVTLNGRTGAGFAGISVTKGSFSATNTTITGNGAAGVVLGSGAIPLDVLEGNVQRWIGERSAAARAQANP